jgi:hypothetical protein
MYWFVFALFISLYWSVSSFSIQAQYRIQQLNTEMIQTFNTDTIQTDTVSTYWYVLAVQFYYLSPSEFFEFRHFFDLDNFFCVHNISVVILFYFPFANQKTRDARSRDRRPSRPLTGSQLFFHFFLGSLSKFVLLSLHLIFSSLQRRTQAFPDPSPCKTAQEKVMARLLVREPWSMASKNGSH